MPEQEQQPNDEMSWSDQDKEYIGYFYKEWVEGQPQGAQKLVRDFCQYFKNPDKSFDQLGVGEEEEEWFAQKADYVHEQLTESQYNEIVKTADEKIAQLQQEMPNLIVEKQCCNTINCDMHRMLRAYNALEQGKPVAFLTFGGKRVEFNDPKMAGNFHVNERLSHVFQPGDQIDFESIYKAPSVVER